MRGLATALRHAVYVAATLSLADARTERTDQVYFLQRQQHYAAITTIGKMPSLVLLQRIGKGKNSAMMATRCVAEQGSS